jgi:hypothetical protein
MSLRLTSSCLILLLMKFYLKFIEDSVSIDCIDLMTDMVSDETN